MKQTAGDLRLGCRCGKVTARLRDPDDEHHERVVCYCRDCQAFARHLEPDGRWLDPYGGSAVFQGSPARLIVEQGQSDIAVLRLSEKGLYRWYTRCCRTPIGNTPPVRQLPFLGLIEHFILKPPPGAALDTRLGEERVGVFAAEMDKSPAGGDLGWRCHERVPLSLIARSARNLAGWRLRGDHQRSPFFDKESGDAIVEPIILDEQERAAAYNRVAQ